MGIANPLSSLIGHRIRAAELTAAMKASAFRTPALVLTWFSLGLLTLTIALLFPLPSSSANLHTREGPTSPPEAAFPPPLATTRAYVMSRYGPPKFSESILVDKPKPVMDTYELSDYTMYLIFNDSDNLVSRGIQPKTSAARERLETARTYYEIAQEIDLSMVWHNLGASIASYAETVELGSHSNGNRVVKVGGCDIPIMVEDSMVGDEGPRHPRTPMSDTVRAEWTEWRKSHQPEIYVDTAAGSEEYEGIDINSLCSG